MIHIILVDDHKIVTEGLSALLAETPDIKIVGKFSSSEDAFKFLSIQPADVVITDINLPGMNGIEFCRRAITLFPDIKFIALTMYEDMNVLNECREAGFYGFVRKECTTDEILDTLDSVIDGEKKFFRPRPGATKHEEEQQPADKLYALLSKKEKEIFWMVADGLTTKQISDKIFRSERTVETHRYNLAKKLRLGSVAALIKFAHSHALER